MNQLKLGIRVESEHKDLISYLKDYLKEHGTLPPNNAIYGHIASSHLKENPDYYKKLVKCRL